MRFALPVAVLATMPVLVACTQNATAENAASSGSVTVTSTDSSCDLSTDTAPAGPVTFQVTNSGSKVTEFYLYSADGQRIVGEVENIGPGLQGKLIVTAEQGSYLTSCRPGMAGQGIRASFTVTRPADGAAAPSRDQVLISKAQNDYRTWVQRQADLLVARTTRLRGGVREGGRRPRPRALPRGPHAVGGDRDRCGVLRRPRPPDRCA